MEARGTTWIFAGRSSPSSSCRGSPAWSRWFASWGRAALIAVLGGYLFLPRNAVEGLPLEVDKRIVTGLGLLAGILCAEVVGVASLAKQANV
jgi:hypothetical protein